VSDFQIGSQTEVIYDPDHPTHAKPVEGWSPTNEMVFIVAGIVLVAGATHSARRSLLTAVAARAKGQTVTRVETFTLRRWWQRWARQWAALWPVDADPTSGRHPLRADRRPGREARDRLRGTDHGAGDPAPGRFAILVHGDRVVWARRRTSREPPRGSTVGGRVRMDASWSRWP